MLAISGLPQRAQNGKPLEGYFAGGVVAAGTMRGALAVPALAASLELFDSEAWKALSLRKNRSRICSATSSAVTLTPVVVSTKPGYCLSQSLSWS